MVGFEESKEGSVWVYVGVTRDEHNKRVEARYGWPERSEEFQNHYGFWNFQGDKEQIKSLTNFLESFVTSRVLDAICYTDKERMAKFDKLPLTPTWVLSAYCDDRKKVQVYYAMAPYVQGLKFEWKYISQTIKDWSPTGKLTQESIEQHE
jgi:hypothetical protein